MSPWQMPAEMAKEFHLVWRGCKPDKTEHKRPARTSVQCAQYGALMSGRCRSTLLRAQPQGVWVCGVCEPEPGGLWALTASRGTAVLCPSPRQRGAYAGHDDE
jgi:hypothetical protein